MYPGSSTYPGASTFPGAGTPPSPPPPDGMTVDLYRQDYERLGSVGNYISCTAIWQLLGTSTGELVVGEDNPIAPYLLSVDTQVLPIVITVNGVRWSGRVDTVTLDRDGPPGTGQLICALVDEWTWLQKMLASQNGSNPSLVSMPAYDTRTGPVATVAAAYINAAASRLGVPVKAATPAGDTSASVTLQARMTTLYDLLVGSLKDAAVEMPGTIWLPGDPAVPGLTLTAPTVVFRPFQRPDKPWLQWSDTMTNITDVQLQVVQPKGYRAVVGLNGDQTARVYDIFIDTPLRTSIGVMGLPEIYVDASEILLGPLSQNEGRKNLVPLQGTVSASFTVTDGNPWTFGQDYVVGDMATFSVSGTSWRQRITKMTVTDNRSEGLTLTPTIGDDTPIASSEAIMVRALAKVAQQLRHLQAGK